MRSDKFSLEAPRILRTNYSKLSKIMKKRDLTENEASLYDSYSKQFDEIAENSLKCDHGTINDCWSTGILMEALKTRKHKWIFLNFKINSQFIDIEDVEDFFKLENEFPCSG